MTKSLLIFLGLITLSLEFFEAGTPVILLDSTNFDKEVIQSQDIWLILFYSSISYIIYQNRDLNY